MLSRIKRLRVTPATVISCIALFVALSGVAYAAALPKNSVGTKQIKTNGVSSSEIKAAAVGASEVKDEAITGTEINEGSLGAVPTIGDNTVSSSKVANGSLVGNDVGRLSGTVTAYDPANVTTQTCSQSVVTVAAGVDMRDDVIAVTMEDTWSSGLSVTVENSTAVGAIRLNLCNNSAADINESGESFHWIAFDVE